MPISKSYPWTSSPLIVSAPMLGIAKAPLAVSVSRAGGLGFIGGGFNLSELEKTLEHAAQLVAEAPDLQQRGDTSTLPIGVGFLNWGADLSQALEAFKKHPPAAAWFFGASSPAAETLKPWADGIRDVTNNRTKIWVQLGTVADALQAANLLKPDVIVAQGSDAGGHGLAQSASVITLVPEIVDALSSKGYIDIPVLAAGGITDGRAVAASICLGAAGAVMGTRFLASSEATVSAGYQREVLRVSDGGTATVRTTVYDRVRDIHGWPVEYDGRGIVNESYRDAERGMGDEENRRLYKEEMKKGDEGWGPRGRMTTYAGTGVGLVKSIESAGDIVRSVRREAVEVLKQRAARL